MSKQKVVEFPHNIYSRKVATNTRTARQKFQRAFAQELLCPAESVVDYLGTKQPMENDIENAAKHFRVSPLTVSHIFADRFGC